MSNLLRAACANSEGGKVEGALATASELGASRLGNAVVGEAGLGLGKSTSAGVMRVTSTKFLLWSMVINVLLFLSWLMATKIGKDAEIENEY